MKAEQPKQPKLKPCPFCGESARMESREVLTLHGPMLEVTVSCNSHSCHARMIGFTAESTRRAWNQRA